MSTTILGSKEPTFASEQLQPSTRGYGQNGFGGPSSTTPGKARAISKTYASIATPDVNVSATAGESFQTRKVSAAPIKTSPGMKNPNASPAKVPGVTARADKTGVTRPTR